MARVAAAPDKRFRRGQVKPSRKRGMTVRQVWFAVRLLTVLGMALYAGWRGTALVLGAPALQVSRITMRGNERLSKGEVLALLDGLRGRNIITVDLAEWQARLQASPWVEHAHIRRVLPSRIDVELSERHPIGIGRISGAPYLVDAAGIVIDEYGPNYADLDLPLIDGLRSRTAGAISAVDEARARLAARVIAAIERRPDIAKRVSLIDVSDAHDAVVMLERDTALLRLGEDDFVDRIQQYLDVAPALRDQVAEIDYVDLRFEERLYVRPAKVPATRGTR